MCAALNVTEDETDGALFSGFLQKRGVGFGGSGWKQRYFVLEALQLDVQLKYYTSMPGSLNKNAELKGIINMQEILSLNDEVTEKKSLFGHHPHLRFDVVMADRTYELLAPDDKTKADWLQQLSHSSGVPLASVKATSFVTEGPLMKLSGGKGTWDRRIFRLRDDEDARTLQYFKSEEAGQDPQGTIQLAEVTEVRAWSHETNPDAAAGSAPAFALRFEIKTHGRIFTLAAISNRKTQRGSILTAPPPGSSAEAAPGGAAADPAMTLKHHWLSVLSKACEVDVNDEPPKRVKRTSELGQYKCENEGCEFKGVYDDVVAHEASCPHTKLAP